MEPKGLDWTGMDGANLVGGAGAGGAGRKTGEAKLGAGTGALGRMNKPKAMGIAKTTPKTRGVFRMDTEMG
jgi:hypothetical protein